MLGQCPLVPSSLPWPPSWWRPAGTGGPGHPRCPYPPDAASFFFEWVGSLFRRIVPGSGGLLSEEDAVPYDVQTPGSRDRLLVCKGVRRAGGAGLGRLRGAQAVARSWAHTWPACLLSQRVAGCVVRLLLCEAERELGVRAQPRPGRVKSESRGEGSLQKAVPETRSVAGSPA